MNIAQPEGIDPANRLEPVIAGMAHPPTLNPEYAGSHDRRILIVDDEESVLNFFAAYLSETYSCATAANAQEA
ncbi:MAG: hypothetical protein QOH42_2453, partial [Blastocatellia bacterium]|nr:hypothetical protein [Blastocatellia bacterium]